MTVDYVKGFDNHQSDFGHQVVNGIGATILCQY